MKRRIDLSNPAALGAAIRGDLRNASLASTPGGIEAQESQGQRDLVSSRNRIPKDGSKEVAAALGLKLGVDADDLFVYVELPKDWKIVPSCHPMWSDLQDDAGKTRAAIFYKAAFYDRKAFIELETTKP